MEKFLGKCMENLDTDVMVKVVIIILYFSCAKEKRWFFVGGSQ